MRLVDYLGQIVKVHTIDGKEYLAWVVGCESKVVSESGEDEIELDIAEPGYYLLLKESEIKQIEPTGQSKDLMKAV